MEENRFEVVEEFMRQIKYDKEYAMKMIEESFSWSFAVDLTYNRGVVLYAISDADESVYREFAEFVEGNGYRVTRKKDTTFDNMIRCEITAEHL